MIELIGYISAVIAIYGVWLNNHKNALCFRLWLFSNSLSIGIHLYAGIYSLALRDLVFLGLAIHGLIKWKQKELKDGNK